MRPVLREGCDSSSAATNTTPRDDRPINDDRMFELAERHEHHTTDRMFELAERDDPEPSSACELRHRERYIRRR